MIEKYFRTGIRFSWNKPTDGVRGDDGIIVDSIQAPTPMIYDGLDGKLIDPYLHNIHVNTLGFTMRMHIHYAWLDYAPGCTSRLPIGPYDVLTGYMSGCIIAQWNSKGVHYVGHLGTIDINPRESHINRYVKSKFALTMPKGTNGFNPFAAWSNGEILPLMQQIPHSRPQILGLVTTRGEFYSILMLQLGGNGNQWCVGGIKRVQPINHDELKMLLMRYD